MKTFALSYSDQSDIAVWCQPLGGDRFHCLNGNWDGTFADGRVFLHNSPNGIPAVKRWEGEVPPEFDRHYNSAMEWIREQLGETR